MGAVKHTDAKLKLGVTVTKPDGTILDAAAKVGKITKATLTIEVSIPVESGASMSEVESHARTVYDAAVKVGTVNDKDLKLPRVSFGLGGNS